jgi:hypothetical protein
MGPIMIHARGSRPLLLGISALALAACATEKKPLTGFDEPPPGSIIIDSRNPGGGALLMWPMFDLPTTPTQIFRPRLNGHDAVMSTGSIGIEDGFYDYPTLYLQGWTAGWDSWLNGVPPGTYAVELVDQAGASWGESAPLPIPAGDTTFTSGGQIPAVIFAHFDSTVATWTVDPGLADSDPTTDEITVTSVVNEDVVVERCLIVSSDPTSCTPVGTIAPGGDLRTVETLAGTSQADHQALRVHLSSDAGDVYQRDLVLGTNNVGSNCQVERIIVHGDRAAGVGNSTPNGVRSIAMSSCYGYETGGN